MTWYLNHQRATEIIAERQREADRHRLAYLARLTEDGVIPARRIPLAGPRHAIAKAVMLVGRTATRLAEAVDVDTDPAPGGAQAN